MQVCATKPINAGEEILVAYGGKWLSKQQKVEKAEALRKQGEDKRILFQQVYEHGGAAKRWHCIKCKRFVARNLRLNHARLCQQLKVCRF